MENRMDRRRFFGITAGIAALSCCKHDKAREKAEKQAKIIPFEFDETTITGFQQALNSGRLTVKYITERYIERIEELDSGESGLNSVIELNPDALSVAESLDKELKSNGSRGSLHGIPVLVKDNIGTADRMTTTAGSLALVGSIPAEDSYVAAKLRQAGAVILGKAKIFCEAFSYNVTVEPFYLQSSFFKFLSNFICYYGFPRS